MTIDQFPLAESNAETPVLIWIGACRAGSHGISRPIYMTVRVRRAGNQAGECGPRLSASFSTGEVTHENQISDSGCDVVRNALHLGELASVAQDNGKLTEEEAIEIGTEAYIYGYPLVTIEMTRRIITNTESPKGTHAPMGQFGNAREYPNASFNDVTAPNADTLYSPAFLDVSKEPYVLSLPDEGDRYFLIPMLDAWTTVFQVPGKRTTGDKAQTYAITGPGWKGELPEGVTEYKSPTSLVWIIGRTYCTGTPADYKAVHALQDKYSLVPLSAYGKAYSPPKGKVDPGIDMKTPVREQVNALDAGAYFKLMAALMKDNPPTKDDAPMVAKMAKIGLVPGQDFDIGKLDPAVAKGLRGVPKAGVEKIMTKFKTTGTSVNGWQVFTKTGIYGTDYLNRATITVLDLAPTGPRTRFIRPRKRTPTASPTAAPTSTSCTSTRARLHRSTAFGR